MNEFLLIFRSQANPDMPAPTVEQMQTVSKEWIDWMQKLTEQQNLVSRGNRLHGDGRVVKPQGVVTNGPYVEIKEAIGGYTVISASSLDEAAEISKSCPILNVGGTVEVRELVPVKM